MNLKELSQLKESELNQLVLTYDKWSFDEEKQQVFKKIKDTTFIFSLNDFSPFSKNLQAELILRTSELDFSLIQKSEHDIWGLVVFEDKNKKYFLLESDSQIKSSLLLLIAVKSGILH